MIPIEFNVNYRKAVASMIRHMRGMYMVKSSGRVSDKELADILQVKPVTFSRLSRGCFSASPLVLFRIMSQIGIELAFDILREYQVFDIIAIRSESHSDGCPVDCHGDCEYCVKG